MGADHYGSISIYIDRDKKIWTCGWTIGINCLDPETGIWKNFFLENLHNEPELVYKIIPAGKNELWLGSYDQGLIRFNTVSGSCQYYQNNPFQPKSLLFDQVSGLFTDRDTSLWVLHDNINGSCKAANGYAALFYNSSGSYNTVIEAGDGNAIGRGG